MKKQQTRVKKKPRGRPFPKGMSGNPRGRPRKAFGGSSTGAALGREVPVKPPTLNTSLPFEAWGDRYVQFGRVFHKQTLLEKDPGAPVLPQPETLDPRKPRWQVMWNGRPYCVQDGWLFDPSTREAVKTRVTSEGGMAIIPRELAEE